MRPVIRLEVAVGLAPALELADVDPLQVAAKSDLIAEGRRQQMGVGIASDVAQQRLMVDAAARIDVQARDLGQPHRQYTGPQRKIPRVTGGQVRRIGEGPPVHAALPGRGFPQSDLPGRLGQQLPHCGGDHVAGLGDFRPARLVEQSFRHTC